MSGPNIKGSVNIATKELQDTIKQIRNVAKSFEALNKAASGSGQNVDKAVGQLNASLNRAEQSVKNLSQAQGRSVDSSQNSARATQQNSQAIAANVRAVTQNELALQRLVGRIRASALEEKQKTQAITQARSRMEQANQTINQYGSRSAQAAQTVGGFRKEITQTNIAVANANRTFRGQQIADFRSEVRNMTSSVQLALGPLNGIAARLVTLQGLFNRNAVSVAAMLAAFTAFTVSMTNGVAEARKSETQFLRTESTIRSMGSTARVTADEVFDMGFRIAQATLLSATEARAATLAIANFGAVSTDQFERVVITAQGLAEQMGGSLVDNTRLLGRVLQNPASRMGDLNRRIGEVDRTTQNHVKTLAAAGKQYEAGEVLLDFLADKYDFARSGAEGLDGAIDGLGDTIEQWQDRAFRASGVTDILADAVRGVTANLQELMNTQGGEELIQAYKMAARGAGNAMEFLSGNVDTLGVLLAALAGGALIRLVKLLTRLSIGLIVPFNKRLGATFTALRATTGGMTAMAAAARTLLGPLGLLSIALPFLGMGITKLVRDYLSQQIATENVKSETDKLIESTNNLIDRAEGVKGFSDSFDEAAENIKGMRDEIDLTNQAVRGFEDNVTNLIDEIEGNRSNVRIMEAIADDMSTAEFAVAAMAGEFSNLEGEQQRAFNMLMRMFGTQIAQLADSQRAIVHYNNTIDDMADALSGGTDVVESQVDEFERLQEATQQANSSVSDLFGTYARNEAQAEKLNNDLDITNQHMLTLRAAFEAAGDAGELTKEKIEAYEETMRRLQLIQEGVIDQLGDLQNAGDDLTLGSAFHAAVRSINEMNRETAILRDEMNGINVEAQRFDANVSQAVERARDSITRFNQKELDELAKKLGMEDFEGSSLEEVQQAYGELIETQLRAQNSSQQMIDAQNTLSSHFDSQRSELQELTATYDELFAAAIKVGDAEAMAKLQTGEDGALAAMQAEADKMREFSLELTRGEIAELSAEREQRLAEMYGRESEQYQRHLEAMEQAARNANIFAGTVESGQIALDATQSIMGTMQTLNRDQGKEYQRLAIFEATLAGALGVAKAIAANAGNPFMAVAQSALIGAATGAQIAAIKAESYSTGGFVSGQGTATSDSIPAWLSNGEFVMSAKAVRNLGLSNLNALNEGRMPRMNEGGSVMPVPVASSGSNGSGGINVTIINQGKAMEVESSEDSISPDGQRNLRLVVRDLVRENMANREFDRSQAQTNANFRSRPKSR